MEVRLAALLLLLATAAAAGGIETNGRDIESGPRPATLPVLAPTFIDALGSPSIRGLEAIDRAAAPSAEVQAAAPSVAAKPAAASPASKGETAPSEQEGLARYASSSSVLGPAAREEEIAASLKRHEEALGRSAYEDGPARSRASKLPEPSLLAPFAATAPASAGPVPPEPAPGIPLTADAAERIRARLAGNAWKTAAFFGGFLASAGAAFLLLTQTASWAGANDLLQWATLLLFLPKWELESHDGGFGSLAIPSESEEDARTGLEARVAALAARLNMRAPKVEVREGGVNAAAAKMPLLASEGLLTISSSLLRILPPDELDGILGHELGHIRSNDLLSLGLFATGGVALVVGVSIAFAISQVGLILFGGGSALAIAGGLAFVRVRERSADLRGALASGSADSQAKGLLRLDIYYRLVQRINFHPTGGPVLQLHPSMLDRIEAMRRIAQPNAAPRSRRRGTRHVWAFHAWTALDKLIHPGRFALLAGAVAFAVAPTLTLWVAFPTFLSLTAACWWGKQPLVEYVYRQPGVTQDRLLPYALHPDARIRSWTARFVQDLAASIDDKDSREAAVDVLRAARAEETDPSISRAQDAALAALARPI